MTLLPLQRTRPSGQAHLEEAALSGEAVLHVQQVLGGQLRQPQQTPQAVLRHRAGCLGVDIAKCNDADNRLKRVQVRLTNLRRQRCTGSAPALDALCIFL